MQDVYVNEKVENLISNCKLNTWIDLSNQQLTSRDMDMVVERAIIKKQCKTLDLGMNAITADGASKLCRGISISHTLERLYLSDNQVSDDGVRVLAPSVQNSSLIVLGLSKNNISNQSIDYLAQMLEINRRLAVLGLEDNCIGDKGVETLADVLKKKNFRLQHLLIAGNKEITDSSVKHLVDMLQYNKSLTRLDLRNCGLSTRGKAEIQQMMTRKRQIQV